MARGKYLSLEEARKSGKLDQFAKEHPGEGDAALWKRLFLSMAGVKTPPEADQAADTPTLLRIIAYTLSTIGVLGEAERP